MQQTQDVYLRRLLRIIREKEEQIDEYRKVIR